MENGMSRNIFHLSEVVDIKVLQEIVDCFCEITGLAAVVVDYQGRPLTQVSCFRPFCVMMREKFSGCEKSDALAGIMAVRSGQPYVYRCHMGMVDVAVPISVDNQYLGCILTGQISLDKTAMEELDFITKPSINIKDYPDLEELYNNPQLTILPLHKVEAAGRLLFTIANHIAEKGALNIFQNKLNQQNILLMQEIKARADLENALTEAEIKTKQSQINPHFLFNVMNMISRQALLEDAVKTQELVYALAELLRVSSKSIGKTVSLQEELNHIKNYLRLKESRLRDKIRVEFSVDETCLDNEIPLFTLQPLVENALIHGLEPKEGDGCLSITIAGGPNVIRIEITDDGLGIPPSLLEKIKQLKATDSGENNLTGLGISSVIKRLQATFGDDFKWELKSSFGHNTKVVLLMPDRKKGGGEQ